MLNTEDIFYFGPAGTVHFLGVKLVGANADNAGKLVVTMVFVVVILLIAKVLRLLARKTLYGRDWIKASFWTRQGINLFVATATLIGIVSIWFDDPTRLTTGLGLVTAGLAFALQKVVTSIAGYIVILRGRTFNVGDRIVMGGVRGDVVALSFTQTTIMEMGQPPGVQNAEPAMWVRSRQYTGRMVTVPNSKIFDEPIYNYSAEFDFIWEELTIPIAYRDNRQTAEQILLEVAQMHQVQIDGLAVRDFEELKRRYFVLKAVEFEPRVYLRLTDNWLELTVRFITRSSGVRDIKDRMSREILQRLEKAEIGLASATFEVVGLPTVKIRQIDGPAPSTQTESGHQVS
jgi:small-conductance mechanosensitive channel